MKTPMIHLIGRALAISLAISVLSCTQDRNLGTIAGPPAFSTTVDPHVDHVDLTPDTPPGYQVSVDACRLFHAKAYDRSSQHVYLPDEPITWTSYSGNVLVFDGANVNSPKTVTYPSSAAVLVCGIADGWGQFNAVSSDGVVSTPPMYDLDIGDVVASLAISGPSTVHDNGGNVQLVALATGQGVTKDRTLRATWSVNLQTIATLSAAGGAEWLTPHKAGTVVITASLYGKTAQLSVNVLGVDHVTIAPSGATVRLGETRQLTATAWDGNNVAFDGKTATWSSNDPGVATVSSSGLVTPVALGQATITATIDGHPATANITVAERRMGGGQVDGPAWINQTGYYTWTTSASGGVTPYTYRWEINYERFPGWGPVGGNSNSVTFGVYPDDGSFQLRITITSADGQGVLGGIYVNVTGGTGCEEVIICDP